MNLTTYLLETKLAKHERHAANIIALLHLDQLHRKDGDAAVMARVKLYRDWRNAGEPAPVAAQRAIAGVKLEALFGGALHSEAE